VKGVENGKNLPQDFIFFNKEYEAFNPLFCFLGTPLLAKEHWFYTMGWVMQILFTRR
jgi:hypothetical protein